MQDRNIFRVCVGGIGGFVEEHKIRVSENSRKGKKRDNIQALNPGKSLTHFEITRKRIMPKKILMPQNKGRKLLLISLSN